MTILSEAERRPEIEQARQAQIEQNQAAIALLDQWLADESGYDAEAWPKLERALDQNRFELRRSSE